MDSFYPTPPSSSRAPPPILAQEDLHAIQTYLSLPLTSTLPSSPFQFLSEHIQLLPTSLILPFSPLVTSRQRSAIPTIRSRRLLHATSSPTPPDLTADRGRLRWPLLWERLGGSSLPPPTRNVVEEEEWVAQGGFMGGGEDRQHVKKLGGFLRELEEEREMEGMIRAKREERRREVEGTEEFESDSDDEEMEERTRRDEEEKRRAGLVAQEAEDQDEVRRQFERRLLELFVDGLDTIDYDPIDFAEPPDGDPLAARDEEDRYFDDEEPSGTLNGHDAGGRDRMTIAEERMGEKGLQNGHGDYDY